MLPYELCSLLPLWTSVIRSGHANNKNPLLRRGLAWAPQPCLLSRHRVRTCLSQIHIPSCVACSQQMPHTPPPCIRPTHHRTLTRAASVPYVRPTSCRSTDSEWPHRCCCCLPLIASTACTIVYNEPGDVSQKLPFLFDRSEAFLAGLLSTSILRKYYL